MKNFFIPFAIVAVILFTSLSKCENPFDPDTVNDAPVSARINGKLYSSPGHNTISIYSWAIVESDNFVLNRNLFSEDGKMATLGLTIYIPNDTLKTNYRYSHNDGAELFLGVYYSVPGWIELTSITDYRITGKFELVVIDSESRDTVYNVTDGKFDVPYL